MSDFSDVGQLKKFYLENIVPNDDSNESEFLVNATAKILIKNGGRNWIPLIVKETGEDQYQVVGSNFIHTVAEAAGLEKVWCIVIEPTPEAEETTKVLAKEIVPKVNLSNASRDEIKATLQYLISQPGSPLKTVNLLSATEKLEQASRKYWTDFDPITKLSCGITKGKKLDSLKEVFYLMPLQKELPSIDELKALSLPALRKIAKEKAVVGYAKMSKVALLDYFSQWCIKRSQLLGIIKF